MRYAIFDLDGTLVDSLPDITHAVNAGISKLKLGNVTTKDVLPYIGYGLAYTVRSVLPFAAEKDKDRAVSAALEYYKDNPIKDSRVFDGVQELLHRLQEMEFQLAILSNKNQVLVTAVAEYFFSDTTWIDVLGADSRELQKPNPFLLLELLKKESVLRERSLESICASTTMIGDGAADAGVGLNAQVAFIAAGWGYLATESEQSMVQEHRVANSPHDLLSFLLET